MPFIKEIVEFINTSLADTTLSDKRFKAKYIGISQTSWREEDAFPIITDDAGDGEFEAFNDAYNTIIYHRCLGADYALDEDKPFGDGNTNFIETAVMRMIVWAKKDSTKLTQEQMFFQVLSGVVYAPQRSSFTQDGLNQPPQIAVGAVNNEAFAVFNNEFKIKDLNYPIKPEHIYFSIDYTIKTYYNSTCTGICAEC